MAHLPRPLAQLSSSSSPWRLVPLAFIFTLAIDATAIESTVQDRPAQKPAPATAQQAAKPDAGKQTTDKPLQHVTEGQRQDFVRHAQIWSATQVATMDLRTGPTGRDAFALGQTVTCEYVNKEQPHSSAKFNCTIGEDEIRVKYGAKNVEVYAEVAATRLLWALGFGADTWYPVTVACHGCSDDPKRDPKPTTRTVTFPVAVIERKMPGKTIETKEDEGWDWKELDLVNERAGGAPVAQRDALKLLAVLLQHSDTKPEQQKLICLPNASDGASCSKPFMFMHDVGLTFGHANLLNKNVSTGINYEEWIKRPLWEKPDQCVGKLSKSFTGTLEDPKISEAGRKFLSDLLVQLTDQQIKDMFDVARFPSYSGVPLETWVSAFKKKRDEIVNAHCGA